jgi:ribosome-associated toxin RatA of RatAB toxin-antitoxin module
MDVHKSVLVAHPAERMFDLIEAAEHYPEFLPWCAAATIVERHNELVAAIITIDWHGARFSLTTRNAKRRPEWMSIGLERGPFRRFDGEWNLTPLSEAGCKIAFRLGYEFDSTVLGTLARPVFDRIADTLVDAFVARADRVLTALPGRRGPPPREG